MKQNETVFEVGMTVYCAFSGDERASEGKVVEIDYKDDYPIKCIFGENFFSFTLNGKYSKSHYRPTLSTTPYTVKLEGFSQEKQYNLEKGQIVWVRDCESEPWVITYFIKVLKSGHFLCSDCCNEADYTVHWKYLTPFSPYENK